uniref:DUF4806 domain-containing protein n=1 Tax=Heterorhabditis bacteriophora TaxID=37862 RepID=A0A1I7X4V8_HETBA
MKSEGNGVIKQVSPAIMKTQMKTKGGLLTLIIYNLTKVFYIFSFYSLWKITNIKQYLFYKYYMKYCELSPDTLDALDWMLNNITKMAEKGDMNFMQAEGRSSSISNKQENNLMSTEFFAAPLVVVDEETNDPEHELERSNKTKEWKKTSKGKKSRKHKKKERLEQKLHSGEFVPGKQNHKKASFIYSIHFFCHSATGSQEFFKDSRIPEDPLLLIEEIVKLQSIMSDMGEKIDTIGSVKTSTTVQPVTDTPYSYPIQIEKTFKKDKNINQKTYQRESDKPHPQNLSRPSAMDLSLVPQEIDFKSDGESRKMYEEADQLHIVSDNDNSDKAAWWTKWSSWGKCFCGTQVRTRVCIYKEGSQSDGCSVPQYGKLLFTRSKEIFSASWTQHCYAPLVFLNFSLSHDPHRQF